MKALKLALIGSAALAAASVSARADDLNALKAQIEALNARVASLETTPSVPAGYQAVSFTRGANGEHIISIMPTADAPAATTITWMAEIRAGVGTTRNTSRIRTGAPPVAPATKATGTQSEYSTDVFDRERLEGKFTTDTSVGEVGVDVSFLASANMAFFKANDGNGAVTSDGFSGWWKMTPNLTLSGGTGGSLAKNNYTFDATTAGEYMTPEAFGAITNNFNGDPAFLRVAYADGPIGLAIELEDSNNSAAAGDVSTLGVAAKATYKMDVVGFDLSGGYWGNATGDAQWVVSGGVGFTLNPITVDLALGTGHAWFGGTSTGATLYSGIVVPAAGGYDYTRATGRIGLALGDSAVAEVGVEHDFGTSVFDSYAGATGYNAGVYYSPVNKLTIGLEGYYQTGGWADQSYTADLITIFKF